jgi:hypothetical protein
VKTRRRAADAAVTGAAGPALTLDRAAATLALANGG